MKKFFLGITVVISLLMTSGNSHGGDFAQYVGVYRGFVSINDFTISNVEIGEIEVVVTPLSITMKIANGNEVEVTTILQKNLERGSLTETKPREYYQFDVFQEKSPLPFKFVFGNTKKGTELSVLFPAPKKRPTILMSVARYEEFLGGLGEENIDCCLPRLEYDGKLKGG